MSSSSDASNATNGTNPLQYEPLRQTIVIVDRLGEEVPVSLENVNEFTHYGVKIGIVWGSQIGAALITLVLLLVLSRPEKRRSTLFVSNVLSLFLCIFRSITNVLYYTSNWYTLYVIATGDYSQIPLSDYVNSILATTTSLLLLICVEVSLVIQANIVCTTVKRPWRIAIMIISGLVAVAVIAVRLWQTILNNQMTMGEDVLGLDQVASLSSILLVTSICFFSLVFCCKLGLAIRNRRQLGLKQFGPMQIVFIMGTQTLIIPTILAILDHTVPDIVGMGSFMMTTIVICLPLTSIWAASSIDGTSQASPGPRAHHGLLGGFGHKHLATGRKSPHILCCPDNSLGEPISLKSRETISTFHTNSTNDTGMTYMDLEKRNSDKLTGTGGSIRVFP
ncbi:fungal pheromone mating factor STE2 GPCR-domain-containing protein [Macrophomina phaseolina]|uniref:Fungal pheromone mating factor STE2 GPCR-domain-containing protein n=1 Tax=Macrophomina phaseolina TaxID=35725 RepID=A0ABQ8G189_9PEZI|nr:fungal pheromone mating factor STE2 GPCR-domain-containing protein [Macrophomina phaseolina]